MPEELLIIVFFQLGTVQEHDDRVRPCLRRGDNHDRLVQAVRELHQIRLHTPHVDGEQPRVEHPCCCHAPPFFLPPVFMWKI